MFRKLFLLVLTFGNVSAMEGFPSVTINDNNIKQSIEEVKNNGIISAVIKTDTKDVHPTKAADNSNKVVDEIKDTITDNKNTINDVADDFSILNINKTVQQLNDINIQGDKKESENKTSSNEVTNKDVFSYSPNGEKLVDLKKLITRPFKTMTEDEKDWSRLKMYDWFSEYCQAFIQEVFAKNDLNTESWNSFLNANPTKYCIMVGLDPYDIFNDVMKYDINLECYKDKKIGTLIRLIRLGKRLISLKQSYREQILKAGFVDGF